MKRSERLRGEYKAILYWWKGFYGCTWKAKEMGVTDEERTLRREIESRLFEIKNMIEVHYAPRIGRAVISEMQ